MFISLLLSFNIHILSNIKGIFFWKWISIYENSSSEIALSIEFFGWYILLKLSLKKVIWEIFLEWKISLVKNLPLFINRIQKQLYLYQVINDKQTNHFIHAKKSCPKHYKNEQYNFMFARNIQQVQKLTA